MQLTDLSPAQLARLADRARDELERRQARKPVSVVREQLERVAADEGYTLSDVFPEFVGAAAPTAATLDTPSAHAPDAPAPVPVAPPTPTATTQAPVASRTATATPPATPAHDPAQVVVEAAARIASSRPGMPILLAQLRERAGMQSDWPAFHAALEQAVKRGWLYFAGNDACLLTVDGEARAAAATP